MRRIAILAALLLAVLAIVILPGMSAGSAAAATLARYEQTDSRLGFSGSWSAFTTTGASGGGYQRTNADGSMVTVTFNGTSLAWIATKGTTLGQAYVSLDGGAAVKVDLARSSVAYQQKVWETGILAAGEHTVTIWRDPQSAAGKYISVDAFDIQGAPLQAPAGPTRYEQTDQRLGWRGTWTRASHTSYSAGTAWYADKAGSSVRVEFDGTSLTLLGKMAPSYGIARITLDGGAPVYMDLYNPQTIYQQSIWTSGTLEPGPHVVTFSWTGQKRAAATKTNVALDALIVNGTLTVAPGSHLAFSDTRAMAHLHKLAVDIGVRHGGSPEEWEAVQYAAGHFSSLGYSPQIMNVPLPDRGMSHNVMVTKPGSSDLTVIVGAHMDSFGVSPGGNDNGSGSAAVLELAQAIKDVDLVPTVVLVLFGHEEPRGDGNADHHHYGSRQYAATMTADQKADLAAMISLDMIGVGTTFHVRYMERGPRALVNLLSSYSARTGSGLVYLKDPAKYGYSDHEPFELAGFPAAWLQWRADSRYHTSGDTYARCGPAKIQRAGGLVLGFLAGLTLTDLQALSAARQ